MTPRTLLLSDVDDTLLDQGTPMRVVAEGLAAALGRMDVVLASSRTVEELIYLLFQLGVDTDLIAENGACIAVRAPGVARMLRATETLTRRGRRWYVACAGAPVHEVSESVARARAAHQAELRLVRELSPERRGELLGPGYPARLALSRRCSVLAEPPAPDHANRACLEMLRSAGYHATIGGRWMAVWRGPDKGEAARAYLAACRGAGRRPARVAAVGDAANDVPLLGVASMRFVVRRPEGHHEPLLLAVPGAVPVGAAGHAGWRAVATRLMAGTSLRPPEAP